MTRFFLLPSKRRIYSMRIACLAIWLVSAAAAAAEEGVLYRVPWPEGLSYMFTQVPGGRITSHFTRATLHAVDIAMPQGVPVLAARAGVVEALQAHHGAHPDDWPLTYEGNFVRVRHADGSAATYAHLKYQGVAVAVGDKVALSQVLGYSGASGDVLEPHLHFVVTRIQENSAGWREEVSVPVTFYVGEPPIAFTPRAALLVSANYSHAAEAPRTPSEGASLGWRRPSLEAADEAALWGLVALWLACGAVGLMLYWKFTRDA
jgi:murein DD-endopeptidase MepM/ murein hydrolase activator NlpD